MGLDALVYRREPRLPEGIDAAIVLRDEATGEHYTLPPHPDLPRECVQAAAERIGNLAMVALLRERIGRSLGEYEHLSRLVAEGTAAGVVFPVGDAERMAVEAGELRQEHPRDGEIQEFCAKVDRLAAAAQAEQNPIVL